MATFLLNDQQIRIENTSPDTTLLDYLREHRSLCGTKEGCASGDCGACTVAVVDIDQSKNALQYTAINSCVTFLSALHGKQLITVEHLASTDELHPVQQAMIDNHGSQCGFCTPGFIMSLFCLFHKKQSINRQQVDLALSGNLCRCTGYRPIIDAALQSCSMPEDDKFDQQENATLEKLRHIQQLPAEIPGLAIPRDRAELKAALAATPEARLFAGSTDLALEVTQQYKDLKHLISLTRVTELNQITESKEALKIGAAVPFSTLEPYLLKHFPELSELLWRFASTPIRNQASLGGNLANASPIGDMPPAMLALNAELVLDNGTQRRQVPAREFFIDYRKTLLRKNEWIETIVLPYKKSNASFRAYKNSKRMEDDISSVCAVFNLELEDGLVKNLHTGFGGVAATPVVADQLEAALLGKQWQSTETLQQGKKILASCFSPIDDVRASGHYRRRILQGLFHRFWLETASPAIAVQTRVTSHA